jgi:acyl dehydratase
MTFDIEKHQFCEPRYFEDFNIDEEFYIPSRTMTEALFSAFQLASADNHPSHYDREWCKRHGHKGMLAHGMQVFIQSAAGAGIFPHLAGDAMKGFLEMSASVKAPVYEGDTLYPMLKVTELKEQNTTGLLTMAVTIHNQDGTLVLEGMHRYLLKKGA